MLEKGENEEDIVEVFELSYRHRLDCCLGRGIVVRLVRRWITEDETLSRRSKNGFARTDYVLARARGWPERMNSLSKKAITAACLEY